MQDSTGWATSTVWGSQQQGLGVCLLEHGISNWNIAQHFGGVWAMDDDGVKDMGIVGTK